MGYLLVVLTVVLVPVVAQNNHCPCLVSQVSRLVGHENCGFTDQLSNQFNQLSNQFNQLSNQFNQLSNQFTQLSNHLNRVENNPRQGCACTTVAEGLSSSLIINKTTSFTVLVRDCGGYDLTTGGDNVTATLTCVDYPSLVSPQPTVVDNGNGSYQVSLSPECSGNNLVSVNINGKTIKDMPVTVAVIPPYTSLRLKRRIVGSVLYPYSISFTDNGDVFIGGYGDHHVHHFDRNGRKLNSWRTPGNDIHSLLVHGDNVLVSQCAPPKMLNYSRSGVLHGEILGNTSCYTGLTIGPDGRLYASGHSISIFNIEDGSLYHIIAVPESNIVQFDQNGNLHSPKWGSALVRVFTPCGFLVRTYNPPSSADCSGLFIDRAGNRLVADRGNPSKVIITDKNNNLINKLATGEGLSTVQVSIAPNGDVWVTHKANKILIYSE